MLYILKYKTIFFILIACILFVFLMAKCASSPKEETKIPKNYEAYTTPDKCISCHKEIVESHIKTAHFLSGQPAKEKYLKGSFKNGENAFSYTPEIVLSMQKRDSNFYQVAYFKGQEKKAMQFDMVIGSGVMGQSYLTWRGTNLYQLPITYFTEANKWANSPGFPPKRVMIDRPVTARCLECHVTYAEGIEADAMEPTSFNTQKIVYGIDCQKCHGPAAEHVTYHEKNPLEKMAKYIVNPNKLTRQQQLDVCTLCHGGNLEKTTPSFLFTASEKLTDFFKVDTTNKYTINNAEVDVHGNQAGLLRASKCFIQSANLTCTSCHNTHENERGNLEVFSQRCRSCHNIEDKNLKTPTHINAVTLKQNCIDCHMPMQTSKSIALFLDGEELPKASKLRTHFIGIYATKSKLTK
jgi:nitrate/TMAO reductase-like tetraheme cytochrome c subunit